LKRHFDKNARKTRAETIMTKTRPDPETFNEMAKGFLPGHLGLNVTYVAPGAVDIEMEIAPHHLAPNGYLHAGAIVTLVDSAAGYGCIASLAEGAESLTTFELKSNFVGTARSELLRAEARLAHGGRTTQVWDAKAIDASGRTLALFRCTQIILYPR
jgi:uncharacterized protein (TIGR00369 family)